MRRPIYLDYNATTPIDPVVAEAMLPYLYEHFGNPSSSHSYGAAARRAVDEARENVARLIGARADEIVFTSGGSEANNMVLQGVTANFETATGRAGHIITSQIEHPAIVEPCRACEERGFRITRIGVDGAGRVDPDAVEAAMTPDTALISVMHANNEVGTVQPIACLAEIAHRHQVPVHTDAAQSLAKIPVQVDDLGIDFLSIAGHKMYAPKGIGALYVRSGRTLPSLIRGADHEGGRRAGTENVLEIVGLGTACALATSRWQESARHCRHLRDRLWERLGSRLEGSRLHGDLEQRLPNTLSVGFRDLDASTLLAALADDVAASAGSACHADSISVSPVLEAMHVPLEYAIGTVRFSVGHPTTEGEIDAAAERIVAAVERLRQGDHG